VSEELARPAASDTAVQIAAAAALALGLEPIPVKPGSKAPAGGDGWQRRSYTLADFAPHSNIGLHLTAESGVIDADLDSEYGRRLAPGFLPPTEMKYGRAGKPSSHWVYLVDRPHTVRHTKFVGLPAVVNGVQKPLTLLERRTGNGKQSVIPPSSHESGEVLTYEPGCSLAPTRVSADKLTKAFDRLAAASLIASVWAEGVRHELALAVPAFLLKSGADVKMVTTIMTAVVEAFDDPGELKDRQTAINDTVAKFSAGAPVKGASELLRLLPEAQHFMAKLIDWLGLRPACTANGPDKADTDGVSVTTLDKIEIRAVPWLWPGYLPLGAVTLLVGDPDQGKTLVAFDLAARVSTGKPWPDGVPNAGGAGDVLILSAEDAADYTIRPRIEAANGDCRRIRILPPDSAVGLSLLAHDVDRLDIALGDLDVRLMIVDPLSAYLPGVDTFKDNEVRSTLRPLVGLAERRGLTVLAVIHLSKNIERNAMQRILGSTAFNALARAAYMVSHDPDDKERRLFTHVKMNLGPKPAGLAFKPVAVRLPTPASGTIETVRADWDRTVRVTMSSDEVLRRLAKAGSSTAELDAPLRDLLKDGPVLAKDVEARFEGTSASTLGRARKRLGIGYMRDPADPMGGPYYWLPPNWPQSSLDDWRESRMNLRRGVRRGTDTAQEAA
jgi:hypothetical protein